MQSAWMVEWRIVRTKFRIPDLIVCAQCRLVVVSREIEH